MVEVLGREILALPTTGIINIQITHIHLLVLLTANNVLLDVIHSTHGLIVARGMRGGTSLLGGSRATEPAGAARLNNNRGACRRTEYTTVTHLQTT